MNVSICTTANSREPQSIPEGFVIYLHVLSFIRGAKYSLLSVLKNRKWI